MFEVIVKTSFPIIENAQAWPGAVQVNLQVLDLQLFYPNRLHDSTPPRTDEVLSASKLVGPFLIILLFCQV